MLRPLFLTTSLGHGGAERHAITLMNRLAGRGHDCHAAYIKDDPSLRPRVRLGPGGQITCLDARRFLDPAALARLRDFVEDTRPTLIVCANPYSLMYASLALRQQAQRIPRLLTYHTTRLPDLRTTVKMWIDRAFIRRADCLVFVSENQRQYWQQRGLAAQRIEVIHNGVDAGHFREEAGVIPPGEGGTTVCTPLPQLPSGPGLLPSPTGGGAGGEGAPPRQHMSQSMSKSTRQSMRRALGLADDAYVIGISAVLRPEKNHVQLLEALAALHREGIPAQLLIIGDGPLRRKIEARAVALGIAGAVRISGLQQDVRPWLAACDVLVLCSVAVETFSLAALEAMAMGRPVIHANLGGAPEMIANGHNGYLFPVGDTPALVHCLRRLAEPGLAASLGRNARDLVVSAFSEDRMVDRYERLFLDVLASARDRAPILIDRKECMP